jgi:hypothetical protein
MILFQDYLRQGLFSTAIQGCGSKVLASEMAASQPKPDPCYSTLNASWRNRCRAGGRHDGGGECRDGERTRRRGQRQRIPTGDAVKLCRNQASGAKGQR